MMTREWEIEERDNVIRLRTKIHPTAIVHPSARIGAGVEIGPYVVIGEHVEIGDGCRLGAHVVVEGWTKLGANNRVYTGACLGIEPQHLGYKGEETSLIIGDNNVIREYATLCRGTVTGGGETRIGNDNLIMTNVHIGHDVHIGNGVILTHGTGLAGHVIIEDRATIGGLAGIHQYTRVGTMAMVGAHSFVTKDVPPYFLVTGNPAHVYGVNVVGLRRNGIPPEVRREIQRAHKILYRSGNNVTQALEQMDRELTGLYEIEQLLRFVRNAERGICR